MNRCPSCSRPKSQFQYLCRTCWRQLPPATRAALWIRDRYALRRLQSLRQQIADGVPLTEIRIERTFEDDDGGGA